MEFAHLKHVTVSRESSEDLAECRSRADFVHQVPMVPVVPVVSVVSVVPVVPVQISDRYHRNHMNHRNYRNHRNHRYHRNHRNPRDPEYLIDSQTHATTIMCHVLLKTKPRKVK